MVVVGPWVVAVVVALWTWALVVMELVVVVGQWAVAVVVVWAVVVMELVRGVTGEGSRRRQFQDGRRLWRCSHIVPGEPVHVQAVA